MSYLGVKWLHLLGAAVLFGTGLGIAFFAWFGYRRGMEQGDLGLIRGVLRLTVTADSVFTATAAAAQAATVGGLDARFHRRFRLWFVLGWPAFLGVMGLFALMLARGLLR